MKIMPVIYNQQPQKTNKQQSFGAIISMDDEAIQLAKHWFPNDKLKKLMPEIASIKSKNGQEIFVDMVGSVSAKLINVIGRAEGHITNDRIMSIDAADSTSFLEKKGPIIPDLLFLSVFDDLIPTLRIIKDDLDSKILHTETIKANEDFLKTNFGKK